MNYILLLLAIAAFIVSWILFFQPRFILRWLTRKNPEVIFFAETKEKVLALTIDDGPCGVTTNQLLDLLDQYNIKATFFLISNNLSDNEELVWRIVNEGHEIGNHNSREEPTYKLSLPQFAKQLENAHRDLSKFSEIKYYRPGSGWYNQTMIHQTKKCNYLCILASIYPYDPQIPLVWFGRMQIMLNHHPGAIILLHDCRDRGQRTIEVLKFVIPRLLAQEYRFVTISDLLEKYHDPTTNKH